MAVGAIASAFVNIVPNVKGFGRELNAGLSGPLSEASEAFGGLTGAIENLPDQMGVAGAALDAFTDGALRNVSRLGHNLVTAGILAAETAFAGAGVRAFAQVETGMREVTTLFGETGAVAERSLGRVQQQVYDLSNELGVAQNVLVDGLYEALSAGVPRDNAVDFLRVATKAGIAGVTDTQTAVVALAGAINAFNLPIAEAQRVADSFFATVQGGQTTFPELAMNFADVAPVAAATGIALEEVGAAIATLTAAGVRTPEATTQIRAAIQGLVRNSKEITAVFQAAGYESGEAAIRQIGLAKAMEIVRRAAGGSIGQLQELIGSIEGVNAVQVIAGTGAERMQGEMDRQRDAAGSTTEAFEVMEQGVGRSFERLQVATQNFSIVIGEMLVPAIRLGTGVVEGAVDAFMALPKPVQQGTAVVVAFATALGPPAYMLLRLRTAWLKTWPVIQALQAKNAIQGVRSLGDAAKLAGQNTVVFRTAWVAFRGAGLARTAAEFLHLGGAITVARTAMIGMLGPAGIVAGGLLALGALDSALRDINGEIERMNTLTDARLWGDFWEKGGRDAEDIGSTIKNFALAIAGVRQEGDKGGFWGSEEWFDNEKASQLAYFNQILESGNFTLAKRILVAAKGKDIEDDLRDALKAGAEAHIAGEEATADNAAVIEEFGGKVEKTAGQVDKLTDAQKAFEQALNSSMSFAKVYGDELNRINTEAAESTRRNNEKIITAAEERRDRVKAALDDELDALDEREDAELRALVGNEEARDIIRQRYDDEREALEKRRKATIDAADAEVEAERKRARAAEDAVERTKLTAAETKAALKKRIADTKAWFGNLAVIAARGGGDIVDELMSLGPDAADMIAELSRLSQPELDEFVNVVKSGSAEAVSQMRTQFEALPEAMKLAGNRSGQSFVDGLLEALRAGRLTVQQVLLAAPAGGDTGNILNQVRTGTAPPGTPYLHQDDWDALMGYLGLSVVNRQRGGRLRRGQLAIVGEDGPELIRLATDSDVIPNGGSRRLSSGVTIENVNVTTRVDASADELVDSMGSRLAWRIH